ncbi:MAG: asparagine synthase (glutamine-hydrolyzing) [Verrucomicrobia bacterium]|nr:asparagine synthase (glutamine-hydrolyzing) [Verrucomicrobiota bacterium]
MCGICGFNRRDEELITRMTDVMAHRGPDQSGRFLSDAWSLGHRRLSIIDLSEQGRQPMTNEDGTIQVVFNGEIYNHLEVRRELESRGHIFRGHSDTEIIPHAYEEYGVDCVNHFQGMFGIAIYDIPNETVMLARDRIGIKPLYYYNYDGKFVFASEIKAIIEDRTIPREVNLEAVYSYLGFEFVPAPNTMFRNIHKLPAGHCLIWEKGRAEIRSYWDLTFPAEPTLTDEQEIVGRMRELIEDAVRSRLMSDVPLGAFLSGGLDSSAIVAMMRKHIPGRLRTFTIGYEDKTFSELDYARIVADEFGTDHQVLMIEGMSPERIERSLWHFDEPMTDLSSIPLMLVCEQAKKHITVCLSGEGGDEVFAGYDRFKASRINSYYSVIPAALREGIIAPMIGRLADRPQKKGAVNMLKRFIEGSVLPEEGRHLRWQYFSNAAQDAALFSDSFCREVRLDPFDVPSAYNKRCTARDRVNREIYLDMRFMMADSVLMKVDKMSMANSLEIRVPLLDHRLVEFMAGVHGNLKLKGLETKHIFRKALEGILPDKIVYRGKQGYSLPVKNFLRDQLKDYMLELLNESPLIRETANRAYLDRVIEEHMTFKHNHNHLLWGLMHIAIWHNRFFRS